MEITLVQLPYFILAALIVGFTKTSVGGLGVLAALLMVTAFPGKASAGMLLPMLVIADIIAVIFFRRSCQWLVIGKILPFVLIGILIGYFILGGIDENTYEPLLGLIILSMLGFSYYNESHLKSTSSNKGFLIISGLVAGIATMLANVAGPIFAIYLLQMGLEKKAFVGTRSWFFVIINLIKIPFSAHLGLITIETLKLNLMSIPVIIIGGFLGTIFLKKIDLALFKTITRITIVVASIKLIFF